jgi:hypothetical protein
MKGAASAAFATARDPDRARAASLWSACALVVAVGLFAWWGTWNGRFFFDDEPALLDNKALLDGNWWEAAFGDKHTPLANRPLACLSLSVDFALFGIGPFGPRLTNLLLHLGNGLLLLFAARRALLARNLGGRFTERHATWLATAIAAVWVAHPLAGDSVAYATQRSTVLAGSFLLLAFYGTLRAPGAKRETTWRVVVVTALMAAMASKEDAVAGPLLVVLLERAFLLPSWRAMRARAGWYAVVAASWSMLALCLVLGPHNKTVGWHTNDPVTAWQWLMTQAPVVLHYLRLSVWPSGLRGAYDWAVISDLREVWLAGLGVLALLAATVFAWRRHAGPGWLAWGWLGALFFLLLAPTSTVMPIVTELVAERRAYLPMLFGIVPVVVAIDRLMAAGARRRGWLQRTGDVLTAVVLSGIVIALGSVSRDRVAVHASEATFWADAESKHDPESHTFLAGLILANHGVALWRQGDLEAAATYLDQAVACKTPTAAAQAFYAQSLSHRGRHREAVEFTRRLAREHPSPSVLAALGICLGSAHAAEKGDGSDPRLEEARTALVTALHDRPRDELAWQMLGYVCGAQGKLEDAVLVYRRLNELWPESINPYLWRASLLRRLGRPAEVAPLLATVVGFARTAEVTNPTAAVQLARQVLQIDPDNAEAAAIVRRRVPPQGR